MKNKTTHAVCTYMAMIWANFVVIGCSQPIFHDRPSEESCKDYLSGQRIVLEKGTFFHSYWTIQANEFDEFDIVSISFNGDGTKSAKVEFVLKYESKALDVLGTIRYRVHDTEGVVQMLGFTPDRVLKLGKW